MFADRQHVAIRIFEPRDLVSIGRGPDPQFFVLNERVLLESNALGPQPGGDALDVFYFPPQYRVMRRLEVGPFDDPYHIAIRVQDERILVITDEFQPKLAT